MFITKPTLPRLLCMKSGKVYSLYTYKNAWDEEKKRSYREPGSTKIVGRILGGGKVGEIKWTDDFIDSIPSLDAFNAHRLEDGTIEFTAYEKEMQISVNEALNAKRYSAGASWVFDNLIADTPLSKALNRTFGAYNVNKKILSLAYFLNISESNAMLRYEPFANRYRLPWQKPLTSSAITRIFQRITPEKIDKFISILNELTMERDSNDYSCKYWALDSTSISTYSQKLAKSAFGYNKDGDDTPQINVLMVVNQKTGEPVYYRTYNGNIPDISTIKNMLQEKARINLNSNAVFVTDKGYSSISNIHRFYQNKTSFLMNLRTSFSMCRNIIESVQTELYDPISYNEDIDCHVTTTEFKWSYPVNFKTNCKKRNPREKEPIFVHIYYDKKIYNNHEQTITSNIAKVVKLLRQGKELPTALEQIKEKFIICSKDKGTGLTTYQTNRINLSKYLQMKGIRILISNEVKDPIEAYKAYYDRNEVEYAFNLYKQRLGCNRFRVSSNTALEGKSFVQFIATSIAIMFRKRLNNAVKECKNLKLNYSSESVVIDKLNTIEMTQFAFGNYYSEVVGGLKELLKAMNIPEPNEELGADDYEINEEDFDDDIETIEELSAYQSLD